MLREQLLRPTVIPTSGCGLRKNRRCDDWSRKNLHAYSRQHGRLGRTRAADRGRNDLVDRLGKRYKQAVTFRRCVHLRRSSAATPLRQTHSGELLDAYGEPARQPLPPRYYSYVRDSRRSEDNAKVETSSAPGRIAGWRKRPARTAGSATDEGAMENGGVFREETAILIRHSYRMDVQRWTEFSGEIRPSERTSGIDAPNNYLAVWERSSERPFCDDRNTHNAEEIRPGRLAGTFTD